MSTIHEIIELYKNNFDRLLNQVNYYKRSIDSIHIGVIDT